MTYNIDNNIQEYKECAGRGCRNHPIHNLKIRYINKTGYFCQRCTDDLLRSELAVKIQEQI